jgi:hypothetical protein
MSLQLLSLQDQGFEAGIGDWAATLNCTVAQSAAQAHSGTKSMSMTSTAGGDMNAAAAVIAVMPGRSYTFTAWFRSAVSARTCNLFVNWLQASGAASALHASDTNAGSDSSSTWTQTAGATFTAPLDAFTAQLVVQVKATGAGAEVHYVDDVSLLDVSAPFFKHGRLFEALLNGKDVSPYLFSAESNVYVDTAKVSTAKSSWESFISGDAFAQFFGYGYFDTTLTDVRATFQAAPGVFTFAPAGATAIGDPVRLYSFNTVSYREAPNVKAAVPFNWGIDSTAPLGIGECLHPLAAESPGTITGTGSPLVTGVSSSTGAVAHLHVTAYSAGTHQFKLQDATALNGAYTDIAGGAFSNVSATGGQRLVITGTIRAYVRAVATIATAAATYSISVART